VWSRELLEKTVVVKELAYPVEPGATALVFPVSVRVVRANEEVDDMDGTADDARSRLWRRHRDIVGEEGDMKGDIRRNTSYSATG